MTDTGTSFNYVRLIFSHEQYTIECRIFNKLFIVLGDPLELEHPLDLQWPGGKMPPFRGGSRIFRMLVKKLERRRRERPRGVWGHAPPGNF